MIRFSKRRRGRASTSTFRTPATRRRRRRHAGLGYVPDPVTLSVRQLQRGLVRAGYDIGPTGVDGRWGDDTQGALRRFIEDEFPDAEGDELYEVDTAEQVLLLFQPFWDRLRNVEPGSGGETQSSRRRRPIDHPSSTPDPRTPAGDDEASVAQDLEEDEGSSWWKSPWLWGGVALVSAGGLAYWLSRSDDDEDELEDEELLPAF